MEPTQTPKKFWFRRKTYGWGWTPCSWEGWVVVLVYVILVTVPFCFVDLRQYSGTEIIFRFYLHIFILTVVLLWLCYKKGESPRWQWGRPPEDKK